MTLEQKTKVHMVKRKYKKRKNRLKHGLGVISAYPSRRDADILKRRRNEVKSELQRSGWGDIITDSENEDQESVVS